MGPAREDVLFGEVRRPTKNALRDGRAHFTPFLLDFPIAVSLPVRQSVPLRTRNRYRHTLGIDDLQFGARVLTEIKLGEIAVKMLLVNMVIHAYKAALEDPEESLKRIGLNVAARPLELGMVNRLALVGERHDGLVDGRFIRHETATLVQLYGQMIAHRFLRERPRADLTAALHEAEDTDSGMRVQRRTFRLARLGSLTEVRFVGLNRRTFAAKRSAAFRAGAIAKRSR